MWFPTYLPPTHDSTCTVHGPDLKPKPAACLEEASKVGRRGVVRRVHVPDLEEDQGEEPEQGVPCMAVPVHEVVGVKPGLPNNEALLKYADIQVRQLQSN